MVDFAGWELPVFYEAGAIAEHHATRNSVGLFDIGHMGQIELTGADAIALADLLSSSQMSTLPVGAARYGLMCHDDGTVIDDIIIYRTAAETAMVVVNASNRETDLAWIESHVGNLDVAVTDRSDSLAMLAVQGPRAIELIDAASPIDIDAIERFTSARVEVLGVEALLGRTGYTGEDGVELYIEGDDDVITAVWSGLLARAAELDIDAHAIGLGARDSLRFEAGYPLYGHELSRDINPFEARLGWAVTLDDETSGDTKPRDFIGAESLRRLKSEGLSRRLETIVMVDKGVPREGSTVHAVDETILGESVSGMFAPTADVFAANVFVPRDKAEVGNEVKVDIRGKFKAAAIAKRPLYRKPS